MPIPLFHVFSDDRFMDLTLYQYGYENAVLSTPLVLLSEITFCSIIFFRQRYTSC